MPLRDYIQNNSWWKLLSLLLATLTWFTIWTGLQQTKTMRQSAVSAGNMRPFLSLPITVMTAPSDKRGFKVIPAHVFLKVIGKAETLATLQPNEIVVF